MCSIAGSRNPAQVETMLNIQKHRAPDGSRIKEYEDFTMGSGRLAILDLDSPNLIGREESGYFLSYNGEIYNYKEIRDDLELRGWYFETDSDTEVLLKSFREWGIECVKRFNGMYSFAIYDSFKNLVYLARDIAGQKPLFYRLGEFAFASEAKALIDSNTKVQMDNEFFNNFQHILVDTLYSNIYQLPPACYMTYDLSDDSFEITKYWEFKPRYINSNTAQEELEELIKDSIRITQRSDVPYTLYYSHGVDSSLIRYFGDFKETITYDISGTDRQDFENNIGAIVTQLDFPVGSLSSYPLFNMAREARSKGYKVVLSGEGADEIFGGYVRYLPVAREYISARELPSYKKMFDTDFVRKYADLSKRSNSSDYMYLLMDPIFKEHDPVTAMQLFDFTYILPSLLQMGDRMAANFGIENRCPFLDKRVIEFGLSLPIALKVSNLDTKVLLRRILREKGLEEQSEKHGLVVPYNKWHGYTGFDRSHYFNYLKEIWKSSQA